GDEIQRGEDFILGEEIVGDGGLREEILLLEFALLIVAGEQEIKLRGKRVLVGVLVEAGGERVVVGILEYQARTQLAGERLREARFANPDGAFNRDIAAPAHRASIATLAHLTCDASWPGRGVCEPRRRARRRALPNRRQCHSRAESCSDRPAPI